VSSATATGSSSPVLGAAPGDADALHGISDLRHVSVEGHC
jgi:hypothetical protein